MTARGLAERLRRGLRRLGRGVRRSGPPAPAPGARLNVGCGRAPLPGWINADLLPLPGVDRVLDARDGIPYRDLAAVYAEHFLEHLTLPEALDFLRAARAALASEGTLRLSTPNLEWVWLTHGLGDAAAAEPGERAERTLIANRAFYGWQHRFLWSRELLEAALLACGFERVRFVAHGESEDPALRGIEQHETYPDAPGIPHVLVVEATPGEFDARRFAAFVERARRSFLDHLEA
jgi:predicted SAM-dependent methyltransferase